MSDEKEELNSIQQTIKINKALNNLGTMQENMTRLQRMCEPSNDPNQSALNDNDEKPKS